MRIDPDDVERYKVLWGDACDVLATFVPGKINSIYAVMYSTPDLNQSEDEFHAYARRFCSVLYDVLGDSGSLFVAVAEPHVEWYWKIMNDMGWIRQNDTMPVLHCTKSDNFYRAFDDAPLVVCEDVNARKTLAVRAGNRFIDVQHGGTLGDLPCGAFTPSENWFIHAQQVDTLNDLVCSAFTPPDGITLDPTVGSGTHMAAALQRGRRAIGIDRDMKSVGQTSSRLALLGGWNHVRRTGFGKFL